MTIGELEALAGITDRTAFWIQFHHLKGTEMLQAGVTELRRIAVERGTIAPPPSTKSRNRKDRST
jgi:hypothetical protein